MNLDAKTMQSMDGNTAAAVSVAQEEKRAEIERADIRVLNESPD